MHSLIPGVSYWFPSSIHLLLPELASEGRGRGEVRGEEEGRWGQSGEENGGRMLEGGGLLGGGGGGGGGHPYLVMLEVVSWPDPRQHKEFRRGNGTSGQNHLSMRSYRHHLQHHLLTHLITSTPTHHHTPAITHKHIHNNAHAQFNYLTWQHIHHLCIY